MGGPITQEARLRGTLERCRTVLANMAQENEWSGWRGRWWQSRWAISDEPLRNDAKNLLPIIDDALNGST